MATDVDITMATEQMDLILSVAKISGQSVLNVKEIKIVKSFSALFMITCCFGL